MHFWGPYAMALAGSQNVVQPRRLQFKWRKEERKRLSYTEMLIDWLWWERKGKIFSPWLSHLVNNIIFTRFFSVWVTFLYFMTKYLTLFIYCSFLTVFKTSKGRTQLFRFAGHWMGTSTYSGPKSWQDLCRRYIRCCGYHEWFKWKDYVLNEEHYQRWINELSRGKHVAYYL